MVPNLEVFKSHPDKPLLVHVQGVIDNTKKLTSSRFAELVAIFHDLGKMNPNFQKKLDPKEKANGYANHAYLSAYVFFCTFCCNRRNLDALKQFLEVDDLTRNDLIALTVIIAKHHGNLPDFSPCDYNQIGGSILSKDENYNLFKFLEKEQGLPLYEYVNSFIPIDDFCHFLLNPEVQHGYIESLIFKKEINKSALDFFIDYQFTFASIIQADKADAGSIGNILDEQKRAVLSFSEKFEEKLYSYLDKLKQNTELNRLRTTIRNHAIESLLEGLNLGKHVFELTAPTGSGKTLMMLSLASELIKFSGAKRIIYGLPFLSITEQVEEEVLKIFDGCEEFIKSIDSKSDNHRFEKNQEELDNNPSIENMLEVDILDFKDNTFAYPFIITTFVRFFETMLSNRNSELLKLPNFSNCIFLLDEIQSLPPRLYGFFVAYLSRFCEKYDSYLIISTATQPNFELPADNDKVHNFFNDYEKPYPLLPLIYFDHDLFNRYQIEYTKDPINLEVLKESIISEKNSVLVILNTIDDTKELFRLLRNEYNDEELLLLNTHFTPRHRKIKICLAKRRLRQNKRVIIISTQLIEAGVDIDFPVVYRDFATVASIVQSAGRCNRNGKLDSLGRVRLFKLLNKGRIRSEIVYQKDKELLRYTKMSLSKESYQENDLLTVQKCFFDQIQSELSFAKHSQNPDIEFDFIKDISECLFNKVGKFQLIDKSLYGDERQYYIADNEHDDSFEILLYLENQFQELIYINAEKSIIKLQKKKIELQLKKMSSNIINVRIKSSGDRPALACEKSYYNLRKLSNSNYSFEFGLDLHNSII